jgi:hypothetical protein
LATDAPYEEPSAAYLTGLLAKIIGKRCGSRIGFGNGVRGPKRGYKHQINFERY